jgi:hypothetical protein
MSAGDTAIPREFARRLVAYEAAASRSTASDINAASVVCEKLREPLSKMMGVEGYATLLRRAAVLAGAEIPWLRALKIGSNGSLAGMSEQNSMPSIQTEVAEGRSFSSGIFSAFGALHRPSLTIQLVHQVWPKWTMTTLDEENDL